MTIIIAWTSQKVGNVIDHLEEKKRFTFMAIAPPVECPYMKHGIPGYSALIR